MRSSFSRDVHTSAEHARSARDGAVLVARDALVDAEVVGLGLQDGERVAAVVGAGDADAPALRQQFVVAVPRQQRHRRADRVHLERAAVADVVRLVADLLLEDRRKPCVDTASRHDTVRQESLKKITSRYSEN